MINIMVEAAKDRFSGYPTADDDSLAPFFDTLSQKNDYPIKNKLLPLDWDFKHTPDGMGNVNNESFAEHVQDRWSKGYFVTNPRLSTVHATYTFRGTCDPRANPGDMTFVANCTDANNDIDTGGVFAPTPTNELVHRKASDLSPFMRGLFESQYDIKQLGYYFSNGGAGSSSFFPHYELNSANSYISNGCEWMKATNPIDPTLGPIATDEEIARCHPEGTGTYLFYLPINNFITRAHVPPFVPIFSSTPLLAQLYQLGSTTHSNEAGAGKEFSFIC